MAGGYGSDSESGETPDYTALHDYSEDEPDYSNMSDEELSEHASNHPSQGGLRQDILPDDYQRKGFKDNFRDEYNKNRQALGDAERGESRLANKFGNLQSDLAKKERAMSNQANAWKTNLEAKRKAAQEAARNKQQGSFFSRHKKAVMAWGIGILISGAMTLFSLPMIAIAEFGQFANWVKNTTQTIHELTTGARTMRNVMRSATVAARTAASTAATTHFQMSRVGMFGQMVGDNYLSKLRAAGVDIKASGVLGTMEGMEIDVGKTSGSTAFENFSEARKLEYVQKRYPDLDTSKIKGFNGGVHPGQNPSIPLIDILPFAC